MQIKIGSKFLYSKILGDKSTEEIVEVVSIQEDVSNVTIFIPSLNRERDTLISRLSPIPQKEKNNTHKSVEKLLNIF